MSFLSKKGFTALFRLRAVEVKQGPSPDSQHVTFEFPDGGTAYFSNGELYTATFKPLPEDEGKPDAPKQ